MKIGIDGRAAKWYRGTGIGTYTYQLINSLNCLDKINKYLLFMPQSCSCDIDYRSNFDVKSITENNKANFWDEVNIPNILQGSDIEIYHVPQNGIGLPKDKRCSTIITLHDIIPYKMPDTVGPNYLKIFLDQLPKIIPYCDGIITVSNYSKSDIVKEFNFPEDKIFVTHLAPEDIYKPLNKELSKILINKYYSIEGDFILYIGGFSPRKNILGLIDAFSQLLSHTKRKISLVIAGNKGLSYNIYINRVHELNLDDNVIFPGFISMDHLPYLYNAAELFVYPSFYEGFGLPPIEAMACGIPVITSNTTSIPEIAGDSAILIDPNNTDQIYKAMLSVIEDSNLSSTLVIKGLKRASELTWKDTATQTLKAYEMTGSR
jgi:glycosyltransferase involved in cell wall biosynthesis